MARAYRDFTRLYKLHLASGFFVTRARKRFDFQRLYSQRVDRTDGVICDQTVTLVNPVPRQGYPEKLRRISLPRCANESTTRLFTNNFNLPPLTIAELYPFEGQVELFFKWIKQHLRIKNFYGTSENALRTQIWIAISVYVLVAIVKKELHLEGGLYRMLQICSVTL
jgi:IS4 transposase